MMGVTRRAVTVEDLMMPVESHGVRLMSIGFLTEEDSPVIWRGPMLHKALTSFVTEVWWDEPDYLLVDLPPGHRATWRSRSPSSCPRPRW